MKLPEHTWNPNTVGTRKVGGTIPEATLDSELFKMQQCGGSKKLSKQLGVEVLNKDPHCTNPIPVLESNIRSLVGLSRPWLNSSHPFLHPLDLAHVKDPTKMVDLLRRAIGRRLAP